MTVLEVSQLVASNGKIKPWKIIHLFALNKLFCKKVQNELREREDKTQSLNKNKLVNCPKSK